MLGARAPARALVLPPVAFPWAVLRGREAAHRACNGRSHGPDARVDSVGATDRGTIVVAGDANVHGGDDDFLAVLEADGALRWERGIDAPSPARAPGFEMLLAVDPAGRASVLRHDECGTRWQRTTVDGTHRATRRLGACSTAPFVTGVAVAPRRDLLVAGGLDAPADLGKGVVAPQRRDGFVIDLAP